MLFSSGEARCHLESALLQDCFQRLMSKYEADDAQEGDASDAGLEQAAKCEVSRSF